MGMRVLFNTKTHKFIFTDETDQFPPKVVAGVKKWLLKPIKGKELENEQPRGTHLVIDIMPKDLLTVPTNGSKGLMGMTRYIFEAGEWDSGPLKAPYPGETELREFPARQYAAAVCVEGPTGMQAMILGQQIGGPEDQGFLILGPM